MPDLSAFYATTSAASFALLGLWWVVIQMRYRSWLGSAQRRRTAYHVSLYFLLIGAMSALALVDESPWFWRTAFMVGGALGALESTVSLVAPGVTTSAFARVMGVLSVGLYLLVGLVAARPALLQDAEVEVSALAFESVLFTLMLVFGVHLAWIWFVASALEPDHTGVGT